MHLLIDDYYRRKSRANVEKVGVYPANVWSFDPFQPGRVYRFRLKASGEPVRAKYVREVTKGKSLPDHDREYEFIVDGSTIAFKGSEIIDPLYVGI